MGYYSGDGVTVGGSDSINPFNSISFKDVNGDTRYYFLEQRVRQSRLVKKGVSLSTAQGTSASTSMSEKVLTYSWWNTSGSSYFQFWVIPSCKGSKTDVSYSRIADSNLFELNITTTNQEIRTKTDSNGWGGWES